MTDFDIVDCSLHGFICVKRIHREIDRIIVIFGAVCC